MHEQKKLTPFENAFFDYRNAVREIAAFDEDITRLKHQVGLQETRRIDAYVKRGEAMAELRRRMTPEAFAELAAAEQSVTP